MTARAVSPAGPRLPRPAPVSPRNTTQLALDLLRDAALRADGAPTCTPEDVDAAVAAVRQQVRDLHATQAALADALISSQDQLLALKTLARVNARGAATDETMGLLLDQALTLSGSRQVLLLEDGEVAASTGVTGDLEADVRVARSSAAEAPAGGLRPAAGDHAMIGALEAPGPVQHHVAFFRPADRPFSTTDVPVLEAVVSALDVLLAFHSFHRRELEQAAVEREHQLASVLAQSAVTAAPPESRRIGIFARTVPASLTGGDLYVFARNGGRLWFAVGDVAGKGLPAAMLMTRAVSACRVAFLGEPDRSVQEVYAAVEEELFPHLDDAGLFLTLALGVVDEEEAVVSLANAGHSPVVLVSGGTATTLRSTAPPLGIVRRRTPSVSVFQLEGSDTLFLGSDGLAEQSDHRGNLFGYDRVVELCRSAARLPADVRGQVVLDTVGKYAGGRPADDDTTLVVIARKDDQR